MLNKDIICDVLKRTFNQSPVPDLFLKEVDAALYFKEIRLSSSVYIDALAKHIDDTRVCQNDEIRILFHSWLSEFDGREANTQNLWARDTLPCTKDRRLIIYSLLKLSAKNSQIIEECFPVPRDASRGFKQGKTIEWYDDKRKESTRYYAASLEKYLSARDWSPPNIMLVRQAAEFVIGNLSDPTWAEDNRSDLCFAGRGLVVGYVQSGKTTMMNMTIASAIDVGYRLVIVLAGMTDLLREQTQRRFDKEVVGKDILLRDPEVRETENGYIDAKDWGDFIEHSKPKPGLIPRDIERLTTRSNDYRKPLGNAFPKAWISSTSCRVVIIKKNESRLKSLINAIECGISTPDRKSISVLVLDDESDQATVNTVDPQKTNSRKGINKQLIRLLSVLPNAQYVGVTATPVANCFTNPSDANDIYPRHFILPLARPDGYMGILDFHDLTSELLPLPADQPQPKKDLHIRDIRSLRGLDDDEVQNAIDAFVLTGALKLFRHRTGVLFKKERHHTMFFSDSTRQSDMKNAKERILDIWQRSAYSSERGLARLENLFLNDIKTRSNHSTNKRYFPNSFKELLNDIATAVRKVDTEFDGHGPVLVVNGNKEISADLRFDGVDIWKIVLGGLKLSRGYTIEGLTVTYFRRKSTNEAALMQMGRWFGYRAGYRDLVRVWISRSEPSRPDPVDIYSFFESVCIDEERLRAKFKEWYEYRNDDGTRITPIQIRPLIESIDTRLRPVARGQMWNARLELLTYSGPHENNAFDLKKANLEFNEKLWKALFAKYKPLQGVFGDRFQFFYCPDISNKIVTDLVCSIRRPHNVISIENERLFRTFLKSKECRISSWTVIMPQIEKVRKGGECSLFKGGKLRVKFRGWKNKDKDKLNTIGEPDHRILAHFLTKTTMPSGDFKGEINMMPGDLRSLASDSRGVILMYAIRPEGHKGIPIFAFEFMIPNHRPRVGWRVADRNSENPVVNARRSS